MNGYNSGFAGWVRFIGDTHGMVPLYLSALKGCSRSVQLGDFGVGVDGVRFPQHLAPEHRFIRGNHDDPGQCRSDPNFIADGTIIGHTMFIGGAWSFDQLLRSKGVDWWPGEELSVGELEAPCEKYQQAKPVIMVTHDCPERLLTHVFGKDTIYPTRTGEALDRMFSTHKPELWIFGHHHRPTDRMFQGTRFICMDAGDFVDVDVYFEEVGEFGRWNGDEASADHLSNALR